MTVALMVAVAAGVAAWVLVPLFAPASDAATGSRRDRPVIDRDRLAAPAGDAVIAPDRDAGDRSAAPGAPGGEG